MMWMTSRLAAAAALTLLMGCGSGEAPFLDSGGVNKPPTISSITPVSGTVVQLGDEVTFTVAAADPDGIGTITWTFGDGGTATGSPASHTYLAGGTYAVTVSVSDGTGRTVVKMVDVVVNTPPTVDSITASQTPAFANQDVTLTVAVTDPGDTVAAVDWDFGDGGTATSTGTSITHTYAANGSFTVRVTVTDANGGVSAEFTAPVLVSDITVTGIILSGTFGSTTPTAQVLVNGTAVTVTGSSWSHTESYSGVPLTLDIEGADYPSCPGARVTVTVSAPQ